MAEIKNIQYEDGVEERFYLVYNGEETQIEEPSGWDEIDCTLKVNKEFFNVDDFILGASQKFKILEYYDQKAFDLIKSVYDSKGGDGKIIFKWIVEKDGVVFDILQDGYQLNLNKYTIGIEQEQGYIELEVKKRDSNNKLLTREDVSVDLLSDEDLDSTYIDPVDVVEFYHKERKETRKNFYFYKYGQYPVTPKKESSFFFAFTRGEDYELGDNDNDNSGYRHVFQGFVSNTQPLVPIFSKRHYGNALKTISTLRNVSIELSNFEVRTTSVFKLVALIKEGSYVVEEIVLIPSSVAFEDKQQIKIVNQVFEIGKIPQGHSIELLFKTNDGSEVIFENIDEQASFEVLSNTERMLKKSKMVLLYDAINQIAEVSTNSQISLDSNILKQGVFKNSAVSTGMFLRSFSDVYFNNRMRTSLKKLLYNSACPLMALGFDIIGNKLKVEDVGFFFKDVQNADFSNKPYIEDETEIKHDLDFSFNELVFGSKKHSKGKKGDLKNFNTKLEALTPIESVKKKFDKQTDFIIDDFKIKSLIDTTSTASKTTDDDLILLDLVRNENYTDSGVLYDCTHSEENGKLVLECFDTPFDTFPIEVGQNIVIESGINQGVHTALEINNYKATFLTGITIQEGTTDTPIIYNIENKLKNRTREGFLQLSGLDDIKSSSNIRHNPKYHLARWFGFFGGGFSKKETTEEIKITDYTNNGNIDITRGYNYDLLNEIEGTIHLDSSETLERLRTHIKPYFNGESIKATITNVTWFEFIQLYNNWRTGNGDESKSRGYVTINTPSGIKDVYLFGENAMSYDRATMELKIDGKIKN